MGFGELAEAWLRRPGIIQKRLMKATGLAAANGKVFAFPAGDRLIVKLPEKRVDELIAEGIGLRYESGPGRPMREWADIDAAHEAVWPGLLTEAYEFVR